MSGARIVRGLAFWLLAALAAASAQATTYQTGTCYEAVQVYYCGYYAGAACPGNNGTLVAEETVSAVPSCATTPQAAGASYTPSSFNGQASNGTWVKFIGGDGAQYMYTVYVRPWRMQIADPSTGTGSATSVIGSITVNLGVTATVPPITVSMVVPELSAETVQADLTVYAAVLAFLVIIFAGKSIINLFRTGRVE